MSTMRSGREIRAIVENARTMGSTTRSNTYDMLLDDNDDLIRNSQTIGGVKPPSLDIADLHKKLHMTKAELDDMKQKFGALKRNYDSISHHSAKDSVENVRLQKMREEFET
jgi:hypothetical protein